MCVTLSPVIRTVGILTWLALAVGCDVQKYFFLLSLFDFVSLAGCADGTPVYAGDMSSLTAVKQKFSTGARAGASKPVVLAPNLLVEIPGGKNPVSLLHELYSSTELTMDDDVPSETPGVFLVRVRIENNDFQVRCNTIMYDVR